ncbi:MAG TPA: ABC transporter permease [Ignavibacteria bacterium]|nr:ABC transporter permease [Ignavibacteria bacterium]HMQ99531.1 ABC transporter permease [Ignavibacteria bacterium]
MVNFFLAKRFLRSKKESSFISFITTISVAGIAIGVAALIIAVSVLGGFEREITEKTISLSSHIQVTSFKKEGIADYNAVIKQLNDPENDLFVKEAHPYVQREAVIKFKDRTEGIIIKGVRNEDSVFSKQRKIVQGTGTLGIIDSSVSNIIVGNKLANKLNIAVGSKVFIIATVGIPSAANTPAVKGFNVVGIYESGLKEYDDVLLYTDMKDAQKLFSMGPYVTGIELFLTDTGKIRKVTNEIKAQVDYPNNNARNVYQIYKGLFTWVELQKEPIPVVLGLIIIVAAINIIGFLLMLVLEKTETIGILKSLGAKNTDITFIFFFQGMLISLAGIISGNILGYGLCFLQLKYDLIKIPEIYYMSSVPLEIDINTGIVITLIAVLLSILVTVIPSYMASRLNPITSLRFK